MLTYVKIKGFESHVDSYYEFSPHFNLFVGDSDAGKSSVIRAICVACYNRWEEDMLNGKLAEIELGTDKGYVNVKKGKNINDWIVYVKSEDKTYEYHKIGKTIPEKVVEVTGMPEIQWSEITETPNVMFQLDKHYLISEIDGKKCSANMFARVVDNVLGLGGVEDLIKDISTDGASSKRKFNSNQEMIDKLKSKLHDERDIDVMKDKLNKLIEIKKKQKIVEKMQTSEEQINELSCAIVSNRTKLQKYSNLDNIKYDVGKANYKCHRIEELNKVIKQYQCMVDAKASCLSKLSGMGDTVNMNETLRRMKVNADRMDNMHKLDKCVRDMTVNMDDVKNKVLNIPDVKLKFEDVKIKVDKYNRCNAIYNEFFTYNRNVIGTRRKLDETVALFNMFSKQLEGLKDEAKVCPMCGKSYGVQNY